MELSSHIHTQFTLHWLPFIHRGLSLTLTITPIKTETFLHGAEWNCSEIKFGQRSCPGFDKQSPVSWCEVQIWSPRCGLWQEHTQTHNFPQDGLLPAGVKLGVANGAQRSALPLCDVTDQRERQLQMPLYLTHSLFFSPPFPLSPFPFCLCPSLLLMPSPFSPFSLTGWHIHCNDLLLSSFFFSPCLAQHLSNSVVGPVVSSSMVFMITLWVHSDLGHYSHTMDGAVRTGEHSNCCGPLRMCACVCVREAVRECEGGSKSECTNLKMWAKARIWTRGSIVLFEVG